MNPIDHSIGTGNTTRPPYIVNSQLNIFTPVGTAMIAVADTEHRVDVAAGTIVKKWCSQTCMR